MSKKSDAKEFQGYTKQSPKCANCKHFTLKTDTFHSPFTNCAYDRETELRCTIGGFKTTKQSWCKLWEVSK